MSSGKGVILEVRNRYHSAVIYINNKNVEVVECTNSSACRIQGVAGRRCPEYCPFVVEAKKFVGGLRTKYRVEVLSSIV